MPLVRQSLDNRWRFHLGGVIEECFVFDLVSAPALPSDLFHHQLAATFGIEGAPPSDHDGVAVDQRRRKEFGVNAFHAIERGLLARAQQVAPLFRRGLIFLNGGVRGVPVADCSGMIATENLVRKASNGFC